MTTRFADTFFYLALLDSKDQHHGRVAAHATEQVEFIVTSRWVLVETANALAASESRSKVAAFLEKLESDPQVKVVAASDEIYRRGLALYAQRADKQWSLTDCISFVVMKDEGLSEALTGDRHFAQAGFVPVFGAA